MDEQMNGVDDFFLIKNMEVSKFIVLDDRIDPESLKKMGGRRIARLNSNDTLLATNSTSLHHKRRQ